MWRSYTAPASSLAFAVAVIALVVSTGIPIGAEPTGDQAARRIACPTKSEKLSATLHNALCAASKEQAPEAFLMEPSGSISRISSRVDDTGNLLIRIEVLLNEESQLGSHETLNSSSVESKSDIEGVLGPEKGPGLGAPPWLLENVCFQEYQQYLEPLISLPTPGSEQEIQKIFVDIQPAYISDFAECDFVKKINPVLSGGLHMD